MAITLSFTDGSYLADYMNITISLSEQPGLKFHRVK